MTYPGGVHLLLAAHPVLATHVLPAVRVLADDDGNGPGAGLGLVVFLVLLVGCVFLFRSMNGRIKRLPTSFASPDATAPAEPQLPVASDDPQGD